jgi:hypothetical protein
MSVQSREPTDAVVKFAPRGGDGRNSVPRNNSARENSIPADDAGNGIVSMLHKAAESAKEDCARAMDLAHKLSFQLRAAEEKARELEAEANHFRDRAAAAENWLAVIHNEVQQTFFQNKNAPNGYS